MAVLPDRGRRLARSSMRLHQRAMRLLVQRVERQPSLPVPDRGVPREGCHVHAHEPLERPCQVLLDGFALCALPLIEGIAVPQREAFHEGPTRHRHGFFQTGAAVGAACRDWVLMTARCIDQRVERIEVHAHTR